MRLSLSYHSSHQSALASWRWRSRGFDAARYGRWKYLRDSATEQLFDLSIDPGEKTDLRRKHADVFADIKKRYLAWNAGVLPRPSG